MVSPPASASPAQGRAPACPIRPPLCVLPACALVRSARGRRPLARRGARRAPGTSASPGSSTAAAATGTRTAPRSRTCSPRSASAPRSVRPPRRRRSSSPASAAIFQYPFVFACGHGNIKFTDVRGPQPAALSRVRRVPVGGRRFRDRSLVPARDEASVPGRAAHRTAVLAPDFSPALRLSRTACRRSMSTTGGRRAASELFTTEGWLYSIHSTPTWETASRTRRSITIRPRSARRRSGWR